MPVRSTRRRVAALAVVLALALVAAACSSSTGAESGSTTTIDLDVVDPTSGPPQLGGTLKVGLAAETDGWNPTSNQWANSAYVVANAIFDHLTAYDPEGNPRPYLAEAVDHDDDFTEWTIRLRPGVSFHDGTPVDADAVKLNLDRHKASLLTQSVFQWVDRIEVVDPLTVRVVMSQPWATFDHVLAAQPGVVAAPSMLNDPSGSRNPVGSGPFRFVSWVPDNRLVVTANKDYWREGMPYLDGIEFRVLPDNSSRTAALEAGDVDVIETNDPGSIMKLSDAATAGRGQIFTGDPGDTSVSMVALNTAAPPFDDPLARRIVATGTDPAYASEIGYLGLFPPAEGPFARSSPYFAETSYPDYDLEEARRLNDEYTAKYGHPLRYTVNIPPLAEIRSLTEASQERFRTIGVDVQIATMDQPKLIQDALTGNFEATGWIMFGQPTLELAYVFISGATVKPPGQLSLNFARNADPVLTAALDRSRQAPDEATRKEAYAVVQEQLAQDLPYVYLVRQRFVIGTDPTVHGLADWTFPQSGPGRRSTANLPFAGAWLSS